MNTKRVNGAAGVILAALEQNRTPAGIALALESAGLLMTPEAAADMASVSTHAVRVAEESVAELKREHAENARLRAELEKYVGKEPTVVEEMAYLSRCIGAVDALALPEKLKVDSIAPEYRNGYVHALADMRAALELPDGITRRIAPTQALREVCAGCASYGECLKGECPNQPAGDAP